MPVIQYSFPIINWTIQEIKRVDTKTRKLLTCNRAHHPKADIDRLYLKRSEGGRGLLQAEMSYKLNYIGHNKYLESSKDWMMKCVYNFESKKKLYSIKKKAEQFNIELSIQEPKPGNGEGTRLAKKSKELAKIAALNQMQQQWKQKPLHGKFAKRTSEADVDRNKTFSWLKSSGLKAETEGFIMAAQDQSIKTKNYLTNIMKTSNDPKCRFCKEYVETVDHLISGCPLLAKKDYITRHNNVAQYVHWKICQHYGFNVSDRWYEHLTPPVVENQLATILWDYSIQTDRTIKANRPDIVIKDKTENKCLLLDVSIPSDRNTSPKIFEKLSKYKDLDIELTKSWKMKTRTIPIVIGALGVVPKSTLKYISEIPGKLAIEEIQKITLLGTSNILRKALSLIAI